MINKDVMLKIVGKHGYGDDEEQTVEFITEGVMAQDEEGLSIAYEESELSGMPGCITTVRTTEKTVSMLRSTAEGNIFSNLNFEEKTMHHGLVASEHGDLPVEITANNIKSTLTYEQLGEIDMDYTINLPGLGRSHSSIRIEVKKATS